MQHLNSGFNKFHVDDLIHVKMLIVQKNVKKINKPFKYKYKILSSMCLVYYNKSKIQFVDNGFNVLKVNGLILIIKNMWKNH